ncbi:HSFY1 protein, partial [Penelope pileata]|nr:HSFY1 protein [Penelope pileata]NXC48640.1 HSFY1 protein [Penelope pileata]
LSFPQKLWLLVESNNVTSIWWGDNRSCIVIDEEKFKAEILGRKTSARMFETGNIKSIIRQLNLYGFSKKPQDYERSPLLPEPLAQEKASAPPGKVTTLLLCIFYLLVYYHPFFKKDQPQLLQHCTRRVAMKRR